MKLYTNKKYNTIALYVLSVITISLLLIICIFKFSELLGLLKTIASAAMPVIVGFVMAYALFPLMNSIEKLLKKFLCKKKNRKKLCRVFSIALVMLIFLAILVGIIAILAPEIAKSLSNIINSTPNALSNLQKWATNVLADYPGVLEVVKRELNDISKYFTSFSEQIQPILMNLLDGVWVGVTGAFSYIKNFLLGLIVSVYLLYGKETMLGQIKKVFIANMKKSKCDRFFQVCRDSNRVFSGFITGKVIDSIIIGLLCFIGVTILGMPYNVIIAVVVGITNIIPFFGPFIGAIPSALLILISDPKKVIIFLIFILCLQQLDGNIIGPRILGDSTGLPPFWVLFSILVGGGLFGFIGMLLSVPTFAVIYNLFKTNVNTKLKLKRMSIATEDYMGEVVPMYVRPPRPTDYLTKEELEIMKQNNDTNGKLTEENVNSETFEGKSEEKN